VPLHPLRLRQRGFNPAGLLAGALGRARGLAVDAAGLKRIRNTPSQTRLARDLRARNVAGVFRARRRPLPKRIWLVDDVVTTGSTLREAARTLRAAGARAVVAVCAARTPEVR
jgi:predicted amidophosphoribosyltransferase